jgi:hypothetical protein
MKDPHGLWRGRKDGGPKDLYNESYDALQEMLIRYTKKYKHINKDRAIGIMAEALSNIGVDDGKNTGKD